MRKTVLVFTLAVLTSVASVAQEINWITLEKALELQKKDPRKIMMDVYTNWCGPCKMLDKNTFKNADVANYVNQNYYAVKFNAEGNEQVNFKGQVFKNPSYKAELASKRNSVHELAYALQVQAYPTIVFMDETGEIIAPIKGYQTPPQLELYLKMFKANDHKDLDSQEKFNDYYAVFKPKFKG